MSKTGRTNHRRGTRGQPKAERRIIVRSVPRDPPDLRKLSRAVIAMALREAELAAAAAAESDTTVAQTPDVATQSGMEKEATDD
ncbi:hypothetical protein QN239_07195 [Mycolicibacterium sp. Y3]